MEITSEVLKLLGCPKCNKGIMLPMYDCTGVSKEVEQHVVYLKGYACNFCENNQFFQGGQLVRFEAHISKGQQR